MPRNSIDLSFLLILLLRVHHLHPHVVDELGVKNMLQQRSPEHVGVLHRKAALVGVRRTPHRAAQVGVVVAARRMLFLMGVLQVLLDHLLEFVAEFHVREVS